MSQKAFGVQTILERNVYEWYKQCKEGKERIEDEERSGRPPTSTDKAHVRKIKDLVFANRRLTISDFTDDVGISKGPVNTVLKKCFGPQTR